MSTPRDFLDSNMGIQEADESDGFIVPVDGAGDEVTKYIGGWRAEVMRASETNDPREFLAANAGRLQAHLLSIAFDGSREQTRLDATKYALEQAGFGAVKNVQVQHSYDSVPEQQLLAMVRAKFARIKEALPAGMNISSLLDEPIDAEIVNEPTDLTDR